MYSICLSFRHIQLSDLHKTNLETMKKSRGSGEGGGPGSLTSAQYRDRAKERRQKYGEPSVPAPNKLKVCTPAPNKHKVCTGSHTTPAGLQLTQHK